MSIPLHKRPDRVVPGTQFGRLTAIGEPFYVRKTTSVARQPQIRIAKSVCQCVCGTILVVDCSSLRTGNSTSCGCKRYEHASQVNRKHGLTRGPTARIYSVWKGMRSRCTDPRSGSYKAYGARGISICAEWSLDPIDFCKWAIENGYRDDLVLDRIDPDGNYEPGNCQWITNIANVRKQKTDRIAKLQALQSRVEELEKENRLLKSSLARLN